MEESYNQRAGLPLGVVAVDCGFDRPVSGLENRPGFYFIPGAVTLEERLEWIRESCFPQPLNRTITMGKTNKSVSASVLLQKLWWSSLGLQFDLSNQRQLKEWLGLQCPIGEEFQPEAAIVNYFRLGDTLGGHIDYMEADWSKPILSMTVGCKSIFLLGGKSRQDAPLAMFLRIGDVVLMAGEARECFHGVPHIFTDDKNVEITSRITVFT
ncbi:hypothetical protein PTKIN_Ptkin17bG0104200 [Pterospermum kingtungense]